MQKLFKTYFILVILVPFFMAANAAEPNWSLKPIAINAQELPLRVFLTDFFSNNNIQFFMSKGVQGTISGNFKDKPKKVFNDIIKAYGLLPYYDGYAMHISLRNEVENRSIKIDKKNISKIVSQLSRKNLLNDYQSIEILTKQGLVKVRGAREFVNDVEELININQRKRSKKTFAKANYKRAVIRSQTAKSQNSMVFKSFPLKYASAADVIYYQNGKEVVIPGVATLLTKMVGDGVSLSSSSVSLGVPGTYSVPGLRGKGLRQFKVDANNKNLQAVSNRKDNRTVQAEFPNQTVQARVSNRGSMVRIEAERNLNAVIIRDYADAMPLYENLILQLDKEPQLIEIQVTIIDVDKSKLQDIGFDWSYNGGRTSSRFGGGDNFDFRGENGGLLLNTVIGDPRKLFASIRVLAENGSARVVSQPQVITVSNLEAVLQNDQSFYVRVAGNEEVDLFNVTAGTSLRVLPHVVGDDSDPKIRLLVTIEDGVVIPDTSVDDIPVVERSSLSTQAIIYDGENLLLGGLVRESTTKNVSKVPLLGDVPGVGNLFKRTNSTESRTERLFLISPRIVDNNRHNSPELEPIPEDVRYKNLLTSARADDRRRNSINTGRSWPPKKYNSTFYPEKNSRKIIKDEFEFEESQN